VITGEVVLREYRAAADRFIRLNSRAAAA